MTKTIHEVKAAFGEARTGLLQDYHRELDGVKAMSRPDTPHADKLTAEGRAQILREQKNEAKDEARARALERYREATDEHREAVEARRAFLAKRLFDVGGTPGEAMLPHAATATDEGLMGLLDAALAGGSGDQARAVLAVAHNRGAPAVVNAYLERAGEETVGFYAEYLEAPGSVELEKHEAQAEMFVHDPEPGALRHSPSAA